MLALLVPLIDIAFAHGTHGETTVLTPEERVRECELVEPDLFYYSVPQHIVALFLILLVSFIATVIPVFLKRRYGKSHESRMKPVSSVLKLFGAGVLICTAFLHMFAPAVQIFQNKCFPDIFQYYRNWPATIFLLGLIFSHFFQQQATNYIRSRNKDEGLIQEKSHDHAHHIQVSDMEKSILANALEFGLCSHSIVVGFSVGALDDAFSPLFFAILVHQFFEGIALSAIVVETVMSLKNTVIMIILYCLSTPLGVALAIIFRAYNTETVEIQLAIGFSEAFCGGILAYDSIGNIMALHFFGDYYNNCSWLEKNIHIFALWGGIFTMGLLGIWA
jgi:zinc transporter 1/2/3